MTAKDFPDRIGSRLIDDNVLVGVLLVSVWKLSDHEAALLCALAQAANDLLPQVRGVVFREAFKERLHQDTFRTIGDSFSRVHQLHAGLPKAHLVYGYILTGPAEAINLPHDHRIEESTIRVMHHPLELITAVHTFPRDVSIRVYPYHIHALLLRECLAVGDLSFDALIRLSRPFRVPRIYDAAHQSFSTFPVLRSTTYWEIRSPEPRNCASCSSPSTYACRSMNS